MAACAGSQAAAWLTMDFSGGEPGVNNYLKTDNCAGGAIVEADANGTAQSWTPNGYAGRDNICLLQSPTGRHSFVEVLAFSASGSNPNTVSISSNATLKSSRALGANNAAH